MRGPTSPCPFEVEQGEGGGSEPENPSHHHTNYPLEPSVIGSQSWWCDTSIVHILIVRRGTISYSHDIMVLLQLPNST